MKGKIFISAIMAVFAVLTIGIFGVNISADDEFYAYVINSDNCRIDSWYSSDDGKYYIFMTAGEDISNVDLTYLKLSDGEAEEQTIIDAFKDNSSITLKEPLYCMLHGRLFYLQ